jgi:N-acetylmuramidase
LSKPKELSRLALLDAADALGCEIEAIEAVAKVEAGQHGGFLDTGEPLILFERHVFYRLVKKEHGPETAEMWRKAVPDVCNPRRGGYGPVSKQHVRLRVATKLDRELALRSASWGLFQILGDNCERCGLSLQEFINAAYRSESEHLRLFVAFILADKRLVQAIRSRDWATFARIYNGPKYRENKYDERMRAEFNRLTFNAKE